MNQKGTSLRQYMEPAGRRSNQDLLRAVADDDRGALRELYDRHAPWLLLRLRHRGADAELEEVVQDTFLAGWRKPLAYSGTGAVPAWIWGIGISRLIDRSRQRHDLKPLPQERGDIVVSAEDQVLLGVEFGDLAGALSWLSPELRAVVQATVLDGLTTKEAAPQGTGAGRMTHRLQAL